MTCGVHGSPEHGYFDCSLQIERFDRVLKALPYCLRLEGSPLRKQSVRSVDTIPDGKNPGRRSLRFFLELIINWLSEERQMENLSKQRALRKSPFLEWCDSEGLPVATGYGVADLRALALSHWERLGGPASYCHLEGSQGFVGAMVAEIPPGKSLRPIRHLYEEQVLILEGRGATQF